MKTIIYIEKANFTDRLIVISFNFLIYLAEWIYSDDKDQLEKEQKELIAECYKLINQ